MAGPPSQPVSRAPFEVVITDMSLPDVNGILLSGQISTILPDVQIIGVSAKY
jgi:YesN/AraC family two-component response regulator